MESVLTVGSTIMGKGLCKPFAASKSLALEKNHALMFAKEPTDSKDLTDKKIE